MIFVGDIALPYIDSVRLNNLPSSLLSKEWFGNLEGCFNLIDNNSSKNTCRVVFNDKAAIRYLCSQLDFTGFALANNHIFDTGSLEETAKFLNEIEVPFV